MVTFFTDLEAIHGIQYQTIRELCDALPEMVKLYKASDPVNTHVYCSVNGQSTQIGNVYGGCSNYEFYPDKEKTLELLSKVLIGTNTQINAKKINDYPLYKGDIVYDSKGEFYYVECSCDKWGNFTLVNLKTQEKKTEPNIWV